MSRILFTGGLGDVLAVEARMTDAEKFAVREIYLATPGAKFVKQALAYHYLWSKFPITEIITRDQIFNYSPSKYCIHSLRELMDVCNLAHLDPPPAKLIDMSIIKIFGEIRSGQRPWTGSGFAFPRMECDLVCDFITTSGDFRINNRSFTQTEIDCVKEYAEKNDLSITELREGKTTFEEFVGLSLGCREFIGIDSAASIIAAIDKVYFPEKKIFVRSVNRAWYSNRSNWYPDKALDFFYDKEYKKMPL
jgi:hypothetical protein